MWRWYSRMALCRALAGVRRRPAHHPRGHKGQFSNAGRGGPAAALFRSLRGSQCASRQRLSAADPAGAVDGNTSGAVLHCSGQLSPPMPVDGTRLIGQGCHDGGGVCASCADPRGQMGLALWCAAMCRRAAVVMTRHISLGFSALHNAAITGPGFLSVAERKSKCMRDQLPLLQTGITPVRPRPRSERSAAW